MRFGPDRLLLAGTSRLSVSRSNYGFGPIAARHRRADKPARLLEFRGASSIEATGAKQMHESNKVTSHSRRGVYFALALILILCLWIGWSDFDPQLSQNEIREGIRTTIRRLIQFAVQFAIPAAILGFFGKEALAWIRSKAGQHGPDGS